MQNLLTNLTNLLSKDNRFMSDGKLIKNKIIELALNLDSQMLKLLLSDKEINKNFFAEVDGIFIFDKIKFQKFVSNKNFLPDSYTSYKNKIGLTVDGEFITDGKDVVVSWPYKDCLLEGGQDKDDAKRAEQFWSETLASDQIDRLLAPKVLVNFKKITKDGEGKLAEFQGGESLLIKGNNLLVLHTLEGIYSGKVKLIYIDPPYNPDSKANTFSYNNSFNRSTWLTFMKNRLEVAKRLLCKDGSLIVAIDENEQAHLGVLLKEIFSEHEVHCITIVHNPRGVQGTNFSYTHEYAFFVIPKNKKTIGNRKIEVEDISWRNLRDNGGESLRSDAKNCFYGIIVEDGEVVGFTDVVPNDENPTGQVVKSGSQSIVYPIDPEGIQRKWRYARQTVESIQNLLRAKKSKNGLEIELGKDFGTYRTVWQDPKYDANEYGTKLIKSLVPNCKFDFPKSLWNVYDCLYAVVGEDKDAIVLDFFGGSGTTAHAVLELNKRDNGNRKFILAEQMHYVETVTRERIKKVVENNAQGSFVYCELAKANQNFIEDISESQTPKELFSIWEKMKSNAFLSYKVNVKSIDNTKTEFSELDFENQKRFLIEVLDKNLLYVPLSEIDDETFGITDEDKSLNRQFFKAIKK